MPSRPDAGFHRFHVRTLLVVLPSFVSFPKCFVKFRTVLYSSIQSSHSLWLVINRGTLQRFFGTPENFRVTSSHSIRCLRRRSTDLLFFFPRYNETVILNRNVRSSLNNTSRSMEKVLFFLKKRKRNRRKRPKIPPCFLFFLTPTPRASSRGGLLPIWRRVLSRSSTLVNRILHPKGTCCTFNVPNQSRRYRTPQRYTRARAGGGVCVCVCVCLCVCVCRLCRRESFPCVFCCETEKKRISEEVHA